MEDEWNPKARRLRAVVSGLVVLSLVLRIGGFAFSGRVSFDNLIPGLSGLLLGIAITIVLIDPVVSAQREEHSSTLLSAARDAFGRRVVWLVGIVQSRYVIPLDRELGEWRFGGPDNTYLGVRHVLEWFAASETPRAERDAQAVQVWTEGAEHLMFIRDWFCPLVLDRSDSKEVCEAVGDLLFAIDEFESHALAPSGSDTYLALRDFLRQAQKVVEALTQAFG